MRWSSCGGLACSMAASRGWMRASHVHDGRTWRIAARIASYFSISAIWSMECAKASGLLEGETSAHPCRAPTAVRLSPPVATTGSSAQIQSMSRVRNAKCVSSPFCCAMTPAVDAARYDPRTLKGTQRGFMIMLAPALLHACRRRASRGVSLASRDRPRNRSLTRGFAVLAHTVAVTANSGSRNPQTPPPQMRRMSSGATPNCARRLAQGRGASVGIPLGRTRTPPEESGPGGSAMASPHRCQAARRAPM